jgi:hypothetical protein
MSYGYTHWTGNPVTPGFHEVVFIPQSVADGWQALCSCGEWQDFQNMRGLTRDETINVLLLLHDIHVRALHAPDKAVKNG